ncbi:HemK2/MTQ2 family protein methyltransferase [Streptomyces sp. TP-A0874]|uniref:HemK2/MTQ2 family protein methyltransferase n=1 Tax=Streptomyces sp. TP-A0874 TaxID=549819 RepID=UPI000852A588|nr:HemK2/MTQ2 family protein methyltransferase [Streptomyces sp. TP-A0874]
MTTASMTFPGLDRLLRVPGVYPPQSDSFLLAEAVRREGVRPDTDLLDICTGSGFLAVYAAGLGARVTAVDIDRKAVLAARLNALLARRSIRIRRDDLGASLPERAYDMVISNPPYLPAPGRRPPRRGVARAWDAGPDGRALLDRVCAVAPRLLRPGGVLLLVQSQLSDPDQTVGRLSRAGMHAAIGDRVRIPLGPVVRERRAWLRQRGLLEESADWEGLVIVRAEKP